MTRLEKMEKEGEEPQLTVNGDEYSWLLEAMIQAGPTTFDANANERCLTWGEINDYGEAVQTLTEPWMKVVVFELSRAYLLGKIEGKNPLSIPPNQREDSDG